jgi:hypothetical protein
MFGPGVGMSTGAGTTSRELGIPGDNWFLLEKIVQLNEL